MEMLFHKDSELPCVIPLDIDAQIDFMTDFVSTHHREYDSGRGQFLQKTHQGQISRSKSKSTVFLQYQTNRTYFVYTERRKNDHYDELRLSCKLYENRLRTHRVMALGYLP